ncbi:hypothetical protein SDC9_171556 [bioreactor metagenome]|uniref:Uncharacterized protein n=1 Tax=bioreactor metagenome TaxID=1076179 RepID=A0A645GDS8_9ZZZZ
MSTLNMPMAAKKNYKRKTHRTGEFRNVESYKHLGSDFGRTEFSRCGPGRKATGSGGFVGGIERKNKPQ